jgi:hypothetical protein
MPVQPLRRVSTDPGGAAPGRGTPPSASAPSTEDATTPFAMPDAAAPGDGARPASGVADVESPSAMGGWEAADVVTPWAPETPWGSLQELGAPAAAGLATLQRTARGMPASAPLQVQRAHAEPARLPTPATAPAGQVTAPGEMSWPAPAGTNGQLDLARPVAAPPVDMTALQREPAAGASVAQPVAPVVAQPVTPAVAQPAPVVAQPVPEVQRQEAPASDAAPASQPPTATVSSESASAASGGTTPQTEEELDVLAGRLYDHIALRLRRELRMDRERTGLLTDLT